MVRIEDALASCGIGDEAEAPSPLGLTAAAEKRRQALLDKLAQAEASLCILKSLVEHHPAAEEHFTANARQLSTTLNEAGELGLKFFGALECAGDA